MAKLSKELVSSLYDLGTRLLKEGMEKSSVYRQYANKEALIEALINREADRHLELLEQKYESIKTEPFEKIIETLIHEIAEAVEKGKLGLRIILTSTFAVERMQAIVDGRESLVRLVEKILTDAGYKENAYAKATTIVAALGGTVETMAFKRNSGVSTDELVAETTKMVLLYTKS